MSKFESFGEPFRSSELLNTLSRVKRFKRRQRLIREEDKDTNVYFVLKGEVKVTNYALSGQEVWHTTISKGHFFGEMAAISGDERSANITAVTETRVAILSKDDFLRVLREDPDVSIWVMRELVTRLKDTTLRAYNHVSKTVSERIHIELRALCGPHNLQKGIHRLQPKPVLARMARRINTDRETVSREISKLESLGVLKREKTSLDILQIDKLKE